jgi:hypothetical protein
MDSLLNPSVESPPNRPMHDCVRLCGISAALKPIATRQASADAQASSQAQADAATRQKEQAESDAAKAQVVSAAAVTAAQADANQSRLAAERAENDKAAMGCREAERNGKSIYTANMAMPAANIATVVIATTVHPRRGLGWPCISFLSEAMNKIATSRKGANSPLMTAVQ